MDVASILLNYNPIKGLQSGLQSGEQLMSNIGQQHLNALNQRAMQQKMQQAQQMFPMQMQQSQLTNQLNQEKLMEAQEKSALLKKYPYMALSGNQAQTLAALEMLKDQAAKKQAQQQEANGEVSTPQSYAQSQLQSAGGVPSQMPSSFTSPTTLSNSVPSSQLGAQTSAPEMGQYTQNDLINYAQGRVNKFRDQFKPPTASDVGINFQDPGMQNLANSLVQSGLSKSYGDVIAASLPQRAWQYAPSVEKETSLAAARGLGLSGTLGNNFFSSGGDLEDLAQRTGLDTQYIRRLYAPTTSTISKEQLTEQAGNAADALQKETTQYMAPFAGRNILGFNSKEAAALIKGKPTDQLVNYLAATMMQPELTLLQLRRASPTGQVTIEAQRDMLARRNANRTHLERFMQDKLINREIYQKVMDKWGEMAKQAMVAQRDYLQSGGWLSQYVPSGGQASQYATTSNLAPSGGIGVSSGAATAGLVKISGPGGKIYQVPADQVNDYINIGGKLING